MFTDRLGDKGQWYKCWGLSKLLGGFQRVLVIGERERETKEKELKRENFCLLKRGIEKVNFDGLSLKRGFVSLFCLFVCFSGKYGLENEGRFWIWKEIERIDFSFSIIRSFHFCQFRLKASRLNDKLLSEVRNLNCCEFFWLDFFFCNLK